MKRLNQTLFIDTNLTRNDNDEWYFEAVVGVEKLKKEFKIAPPGKFVYAEWRKCDKAVDNLISEMLNLRGIPLAYIIKKYDSHVTIMFDDVAYDVDPEYCHINAAPLTGSVFNRDNVEVQKLLKSLTKGTEALKCIDKSMGVRDNMKAIREHYNGSAKGELCMNITKVDLKDIYFKYQDI